MKKGLFTFLAVLMILLTCAAFQASAWDEDYSTSYYYDCDGDGIDETDFYISYDISGKTVCILNFNSPLNHVIIPEKMTLGWYDYDYYEYETADFTVTAINGSVTEYSDCEITSVEVPYTVQTIEPKALGYYYGYDENYEEILIKSEDFKLFCTENTAAHNYAVENSFECECYKNISATEVSFPSSSYTYTSTEILPQITVLYNSTVLSAGTDYTVVYTDNINSGTALVTITGTSEYRGTVTGTFEILPKAVTNAATVIAKELNYTGKAVKPTIAVSFLNRKLSPGKDFKVSYISNTEPGTAYATVTFIGNYSGSKKLSFKIVLGKITSFKATALSSTKIKLTWTNVKCDEFLIYKYNSSNKKYTLLKKVKSNTYTDSKLSQITGYYYRVRAIKYNSSGTNTYGKIVSVQCYTKLNTPTIKLATLDKAASITWSKNSKATGYQVYRADWFTEFKRIRAVSDKTVGSFKSTGLDNDNNYFYKVRSYRTINSVTYYSDFSEVKATLDTSSILEAATLKPRTSFKVYNTQGKTSTSWTYYLTDNDIKILDKFEATHFAKGMSREDVLRITLNWINLNVKYAVGDDWDKISGKSWVEAIFTDKLGQCAQYNGAMAAMMAHLGYNAYVIQGYRGTWEGNHWQHFWCETKIGGRIYVMETGNYGCDGSWSYFLTPYSQTKRYIKNQENM